MNLPEEDRYPMMRMSIVSRYELLKHGTKEHKVSYKAVENYLKQPAPNNTAAIKDNADQLARVFDHCLDYGCSSAFPITNINYPATDAVKAQVTMDGQDVCGGPTVRVWAKKEEAIIQLSASLEDYNFDPMYKACDVEGAHGNSEQSFETVQACCNKFVAQDKALIQEAEEKAQELVKTFAIFKE
jgi:hypothetical protein